MSELIRVTTVVRLKKISTSPPSITTHERFTQARGGKRTFTELIPVSDARLFQRLQAEVRVGDRIRVTVVTDWDARPHRKWLESFELVERA